MYYEFVWINELLKGKVIIMEEVTIKNNIFPYIENLVSSLEIGLLNIFNKYFYRYNLEVKRDNEITKIAIKGHLKSLIRSRKSLMKSNGNHS